MFRLTISAIIRRCCTNIKGKTDETKEEAPSLDNTIETWNNDIYTKEQMKY
jgi:hypothetical protein